MKKVPIGIQDFKKLRDSGSYFVDKSKFIDDVLKRGAEVFLFTRPRRFGKSLNLSMLDAYLSEDYPDNDWFDDLDVSVMRPDDPEKNSNPVIHLDMKCLGDGTFGQFIYLFRDRMVKLYLSTLDFENADEIRRDPGVLFPALETDEGLTKLMTSLTDLMGEVRRRRNKKVILLIDEYDDAANKADDELSADGKKTNRRRILDFLGTSLGSALKGNDDLRFAVLTGVMRIGKESIFSGLNNFMVDTVFDSKFSEAFGFTAEDVKGICKDYGHSERYEEARQWYDGYRFGKADVYNPWSILNYIDSGFEPKSYWAGTSGNDIIDNLMDDLSADVFDNLEMIVKGEEVSQVLSDTVVYEDILHGGDAGDLFSVMAMSGYLRAVPTGNANEFDLSIPNLEVSRVFKDMFVRRMGVSGKRVRDLEKSLISGDPDRVSDLLESFVMSIDPKVMSHEHAYEILCIGLLMHLEGPYEVSNEIHQGKGYCDILLKSTVRSYPHAIIELKRWRENDPGIDVLADGGLKQIHDKAYTHRLEGTVLLYGIAFRGTDVAVKSETITL